MKFRISSARFNLVIFSLMVAGLVVVAVVIAFSSHRKPAAQTSPTPVAAIPSAHTADTAAHAGPQYDTTPSPTGTPASQSPTPSPALAAPDGPYLNTHSISLSNASTLMDSTCSGPAGADCVISADMNGKSLNVSDSKTITATGVELVWDAKKLTAGTWQIRAVASQNGQTAQSPAESLVVTP